MAKYIKTEEGYKTVDGIDGAATVEMVESVVEMVESAAETAQTTADGKMNAHNPVGTGSFSMNRQVDTVVGDYSHAEGYYTTASGDYSHAEGYKTEASGHYQHVQGRFNIDDVDAEGKALNTYAHIVGNGTSDTDRSNAHTVDWNGVGWYQGGLQVGGNAQDDGAKSVLLEGDAIPVPSTASIGQTIVVKAVDETGKPTEWEAVDLPSGGSDGGIVLNCKINTEQETILESPIFNFEEIKTEILNGKNVVLLADDSFESAILVYKPTAVGDYYIEFRPNNSSMPLYLLNDNTMSDTN